MEPKKILIVDDDKTCQTFLRSIIKKCGNFVFKIAVTGEEAVKKAASFAPDLIIMDIILEGEMDGIEAVEEIQETIDVPIVYTTASLDEDILNRARYTKSIAFAIKPLEKKEVVKLIEKVFGHDQS